MIVVLMGVCGCGKIAVSSVSPCLLRDVSPCLPSLERVFGSVLNWDVRSTIGNMLSEKMNWKFLDADDFHPQCNKNKMQRGIALTDEDRRPWLMSLHSLLLRESAGGENIILACSALKKTYRDTLTNGTADKCETKVEMKLEVLFVHLHGPAEVIGRRLQQRQGHFMPPSLLHSQLDTLEPLGAGEYFINIDVDRDESAVIADIIKHLVSI